MWEVGNEQGQSSCYAARSDGVALARALSTNLSSILISTIRARLDCLWRDAGASCRDRNYRGFARWRSLSFQIDGRCSGCLSGAFCPGRIPSLPFLTWPVIDPVASRRNGALASFIPWPSAIPRETRNRPLAVLHCVSALRVQRPPETVSHFGHGKARDGRGLPNQNRRHIP
jgi:hypothetical protein